MSRTNNHPDYCSRCAVFVEAGKGVLVRATSSRRGGRWLVYCSSKCETGGETRAPGDVAHTVAAANAEQLRREGEARDTYDYRFPIRGARWR